MMFPVVRELAVDGIPVTVTCRVLKLSRQPYYRWLADPVTPSEVVEAYRANALFDAHQDAPSSGIGCSPTIRVRNVRPSSCLLWTPKRARPIGCRGERERLPRV